MNTLHICTSADKNYKLPLTALLNSIYKNSASRPCVMHILYTGLSKRYQQKIQRKYKNTNLSVEFVDMSSYNFDFFELDMQYWTKAIFYRIMIPEIFKNLERILYIDGDTLVVQDLVDLFNMEFQDDAYLAMIVDKFSWKHQMFRLGVSNYFNSGVILFDIDKCRKDNFSYKCIKWLHDTPKKPIYPDQDAINVIADGKIVRVNNLYNKMIVPKYPITVDIKPFIIHFVSETKPWMCRAPVKYCSFYRKYIPSKFARTKVLLGQLLNKYKNLAFYKQKAEVLQKTKIIEQMQYYVFTKLVYTKTLRTKEQDILDVLKKMRDTQCL